MAHAASGGGRDQVEGLTGMALPAERADLSAPFLVYSASSGVHICGSRSWGIQGIWANVETYLMSKLMNGILCQTQLKRRLIAFWGEIRPPRQPFTT